MIVPKQSQSGQMLSLNEPREVVKLGPSHEKVFSALTQKLSQQSSTNYGSFEPAMLDLIPYVAMALLSVNFTTLYLQSSKPLYKMALCFRHQTIGSRSFYATGLTGPSGDALKQHRNFLLMLMSLYKSTSCDSYLLCRTA